MSDTAFRKALKQKTHKERSQPSDRVKYGLLEKKKDYVERARDFHKKEATIQRLRTKAAERNPDEFYFAMERARTKDGVHDGSLTRANKYSQDELRLMKTQDVKYIALKAQQEAKKVEKLSASLHMIGAAKPQQHVVFVDDVAEARNFDAAEHFDTAPELLDRTFNRPTTAQLEAGKVVVGGDKRALRKGKLEKTKAVAYDELLKRSERQDRLLDMARKMEFQKALMGRGTKRKMKVKGEDGEKKSVFRWKRERQK